MKRSNMPGLSHRSSTGTTRSSGRSAMTRSGSMATLLRGARCRRNGTMAWWRIPVITSPPPVGVAFDGSHSWPCWSTTVLSRSLRTGSGSTRSAARPAKSSAARPSGVVRWRSWLPVTSVTGTSSHSASSASNAMGLFSRIDAQMVASGRGGRSSRGTSSARPNAATPRAGGIDAVTSKMSPSSKSSLSAVRATNEQRSAKRIPCK